MSTLWAIYNEEGREILEDASFVSYSYNTQSSVLSSPIEEGSFAHYNKIAKAGSLKLSLALAGNIEDVEEVIQTLEQEKSKASKLTIVSPEKSFNNYTLQTFAYSQTAVNGVIIFDLDFVEIRELGENSQALGLSMQDVSNPSDASTFERGRVALEEIGSVILSNLF